jgi:PAS domain S-box-containing protein
MSSAPEIAFDESDEFVSPGISPKHFQLLTALNSQATSKVEFRTLIEGLVDSISRAIHCDCADIALLDPEDSQSFREFALEYPHTDGRVQQLPLISRDEALWPSQVVELRRSVKFLGPQSESRSVAGLKGFKAQYHFPLVNQGRGFGVLTLASFAEDGFKQTEISFLEQVAAQIAIAIENARAHDQIAALNEQLECERVYVEDEILAGAKFEEIVGSSESLAQALGHVARVAPTDSTVLITGESGTAGFFSQWSREPLLLYGLDPAQGDPRLEESLALVHPQDREFMKSLIEHAVAQASGLDFTKRIVRHDGEVRYIRWVGAPVVEDGTLQRIVGTAIDVTEHELLSQELRRRVAYLAGAQRLSHTGSFGWRPDDGEIVWSDETYRIFEYDRAEKPTMNMVFQRIHPQDRAPVQQGIDRASQTGSDFEHEYRLLLADGRVKHVHATAHAVQNDLGHGEFIGAVTDITGRKTAEDKIRRLVEVNILGIFIANVEGEIVEANQAFLQMLQYGSQDLVSGRLRWTDLTPAELRERDERALTEALATGVFQPYEKEFLRKDGSRLPVLIGGAPFQSANEGVGFVLDLSEQKRAEEKLREQEMELRQILDLSPQQVAVYGPNRERLFTNRSALEYLGMSLDEWRQMPGNVFRPGWFIHPDDQERAARAYSDSSRSSGSAYELRVRGADGNYRWFLVRFNALHDDKGQFMRWYVAATDIDERKRAEEKLQQENVALREEIDKASMFEEIVGTSVALQSVLFGIAKVSPTDSTVLITGETGTGKELVARAIHKRSSRSSGVFVGVNCAVIPHDLVASELFGHEKGAFTGAAQRRLGRFELAEGGTIFLDEVGDLPPETQVALLRVLQEREFERVGGGRPIRCDVRVVAATNRDLQKAIAEGTFRSDLFYRLNVFPLEVPPLRKRKGDIPLLVHYLIDRYAKQARKRITHVSKKSLDLLQQYPWPGNVRELQNIVERSVILCETEEFTVDEKWLSRTRPPLDEPGNMHRLSDKLAYHERETIEAALRESRGRVFGPNGAAVKLGLPRSTLESRIQFLKINKHLFKGLGLQPPS